MQHDPERSSASGFSPASLTVPLYSPEGEPLSDLFLITPILFVFSAALGTLLIWVYFRACMPASSIT
jgi:hypothetical protein